LILPRSYLQYINSNGIFATNIFHLWMVSADNVSSAMLVNASTCSSLTTASLPWFWNKLSIIIVPSSAEASFAGVSSPRHSIYNDLIDCLWHKITYSILLSKAATTTFLCFSNSPSLTYCDKTLIQLLP
jgi:hypothetical protein